MGQKINPILFRLGKTKNWLSRWFPKKGDFKYFLEEDVLIRQKIKEKILSAGIDKIVIERTGNKINITIKTARPGLVIGRQGKGIEELTKLIKKSLEKLRRKRQRKDPVEVNLNIEELKRSEVSANVVAQNIAFDLEKRLPYRRVMKKYLSQIMQNKDVYGAKIRLSGRLQGAEIARKESINEGKLPLQTLRADIDYGEATAFTTYGTIGVKVWIYKGEKFEIE